MNQVAQDANDLVTTIERMYAAVGVDDRTCLSTILAEDFYAFENGVRMSGRELLNLTSTLYSEGKRYRWSVTSPKIEIQGDLGVVAYVNVGSVAEAVGAEPVPVSWLETVLLRRRQSGWRVTFLHSTRTKATASGS